VSVPFIYGEIVSGGPHELRVRAFLDEDDEALFSALRTSPDGAIETAYWLPAQGDKRTRNAIVSLHCRCGGEPFDISFHFEQNHPSGGRQVAALRRASTTSLVVVEVLFAPAPDASPARLTLAAHTLHGTSDTIARLSSFF